MISQTTISQVNEAASIKEVVEDFVSLKKSGSNYKGCCPFHTEKTPSFTVNPAKGMFYCFGCQKGGDSVTFLMESGKTYPDAIEHLAKKYGIQVERTKEVAEPHFEKKTQVRATLTALQAHFTQNDTNPGYKYWKKRGYTQEILNMYGVGYCESVEAKPIEPDALKVAGIANDKGNLSLYKRATLPLHDYSGNIVSFVGRSLEKTSKGDKYLNGRNVEGIYQKGQFLYNLHRADAHIRKSGEVWLLEGYADSMALTQMGIQNNIAFCGASVTDAHIRTLKRYNGTQPLKIYWAGDRPENEAIEKARWDSVEKLLQLGEVRLVEWPSGCKDAGEMIEKGIPWEKVKTSDAIEEFIKANWTAQFSENASPVEKSIIQDKIAELISRVGKENARDIYINHWAEIIEIKPRKFDQLVKSKMIDHESQTTTKTIDEHPYIRVCDDYYQRQVRPDHDKNRTTVEYVKRNRANLLFDFSANWLRSVPFYHNWIIKPEHLNYQRDVIIQDEDGGSYKYFNEYHPLPFEPKKFNIPDEFFKDPENYDYEQIPEIANTAYFFKHIFDFDKYGNQFVKIGWDWLTICYLYPTKRLPALCLVSSEEGTGKSTFINFALEIFGHNATSTDASRIAGNFNAMLKGKVLAGIEETKDSKGEIENKLKDLITSFRQVVEAKFKEAREEISFCKYIFASNHEEDFMKVGSQTTRFFVMKVHPFKKYIHNFEELLYREIPYVLYFMQKRKVLTPEQNRLWFDPKILENEALLKLRQSSKDVVHQNLEELIPMIWLKTGYTGYQFACVSKELQELMCAFAGKAYERQTANYFLKVAQKHMRATYSGKSMRYERLQFAGLLNQGWPYQEYWEIEEKKGQGRPLLFFIWNYLEPEEITDPKQGRALLENMLQKIDEIKATGGEAAISFMHRLEVQLKKQPKPKTEKMPF